MAFYDKPWKSSRRKVNKSLAHFENGLRWEASLPKGSVKQYQALTSILHLHIPGVSVTSLSLLRNSFQLAFFYSKGHLPSVATQDMYNRPIVFRICSGHTLWVTCLLLTFCHLHPLPHDKSQEWSCVSVSSIYHNLQGNTAKTQKVSNSEASGSHWNWSEKLGPSCLGHLYAARLGRHFQINWAVWKSQRPAKEPER